MRFARPKNLGESMCSRAWGVYLQIRDHCLMVRSSPQNLEVYSSLLICDVGRPPIGVRMTVEL